MNRETDNRKTATEALAVIIRQRTFNLMSTGRMMCSEAVLSALNQGLDRGRCSPHILDVHRKS